MHLLTVAGMPDHRPYYSCRSACADTTDRERAGAARRQNLYATAFFVLMRLTIPLGTAGVVSGH